MTAKCSTPPVPRNGLPERACAPGEVVVPNRRRCERQRRSVYAVLARPTVYCEVACTMREK